MSISYRNRHLAITPRDDKNRTLSKDYAGRFTVLWDYPSFHIERHSGFLPSLKMF